LSLNFLGLSIFLSEDIIDLGINAINLGSESISLILGVFNSGVDLFFFLEVSSIVLN
jgi:hypothetical protein